jgi:ribosomal protein S19E (S16A)
MYVRAAAIIRKVYLKPNIGTAELRNDFGGEFF